MADRRQSPDRARVVPFDARHTRNPRRVVGLTEEERQILLAELAEIAAELDDIQSRTMEIAARVNQADRKPQTRRSGAA